MRPFYFTFLLITLFNNAFSQNWQELNDSLLAAGLANSVVRNGNTIVIGTMHGIFTSEDYGVNWLRKNEGLDTNDQNIKSVAYLDPFYYALGNNTVYRTDSTFSWTDLSSSGLGWDCEKIFAWNHRLYITNYCCTFKSLDSGNTFSYVNARYEHLVGEKMLTKITGYKAYFLDTALVADTVLLSGTILNSSNPLIFFEPSGNFIFYLDQELNELHRANLTGDSVGIFSHKATFSMLDSAAGCTWTLYPEIQVSYNYLMIALRCVTVNNHVRLYAYKSTDNANSFVFQPALNGLPSNLIGSLFTLNEDTLLVNAINGKLYLSFDGGSSWTWRTKGFNVESGMGLCNVNGTLFLRSGGSFSIWNGILRSNDNGQTWETCNNGIPNKPSFADSAVTTVTTDFFQAYENTLFTGTGYQLYRSQDYGDNWSNIPKPTPGQLIGAYGGDENTHYIATAHDSAGGTHYHFAKTEDGGDTWQNSYSITNISGSGGPAPLFIIGTRDTMLLVQRRYQPLGLRSFEFYKSVNDGDSWTNITPPLLSSHVRGIDYTNIVGTHQDPVLAFGSNTDTVMISITHKDTSGGNIYNQMLTDSLYLIQNGIWTPLIASGLPLNADFQKILFIQGTWYLATNVGVFESSDNGNSWNSSARTTSELPMGMKVSDMMVSQYLFLSTYNSGIWKNNTPLITAAGRPQLLSKASVSVYPNPNNGAFQFSIFEKLGYCTVRVLDVAGRELHAFNANLNSGDVFEIQLDLTGGVYLLKLDGSKTSLTEKFIVD